ncbi:hypothetical protein MLD38_033122 [Melastoma candidum]|uniref:Uncharacterized protein n=1 Tax=Melastoma candidum TaxID=119954 RepID=A0ACB9M6B4_9MYRT|nr:hypothetical protein MLD38_033122 [Melastoma candidum]
MAKSILVAMTLVMGILLCSVSAMKEDDQEMKKVIHVGGEIHCQDCTKDWNHWTKGSTPIKGAKVSVTCMDERQRVVYYGSDMSDEAGRFNVIFGKYVHGKPVTDRLCKVRLVSSPDQACNVATDFAGGRSGVKLEHPTFVYREITKYTVGPLYYTPPMCEEPNI